MGAKTLTLDAAPPHHLSPIIHKYNVTLSVLSDQSIPTTEADSATPAKTPVCTLHLTLRTLYIVLENQNLIINDSINNT